MGSVPTCLLSPHAFRGLSPRAASPHMPPTPRRDTHRPLARNPCKTEGLPVSNPKEDFSNCLPRPAKRVSAHSVVKITWGQSPKTSEQSLLPTPGSQTTEDSETGCGRTRKAIGNFRFVHPSALARTPCEPEGWPVSNPKGKWWRLRYLQTSPNSPTNHGRHYIIFGSRGVD